MLQPQNIDKEYLDWIAELSNRYRQSQIKAAVKVNGEMLRFYWSVGKDITERQYDNRYGSHFYEKLSHDLSQVLNKKKGFSPTSLKYTKYFYSLYAPLFANLQQNAEKLDVQNRQQLVGKLSDRNHQQLVDDFEKLFCIPWGHHVQIIGKCSDNPREPICQQKKKSSKD